MFGVWVLLVNFVVQFVPHGPRITSFFWKCGSLLCFALVSTLETAHCRTAAVSLPLLLSFSPPLSFSA